MREVADRDGQGRGRVNAFQMSIGGPRVEVVGDGSPAMVKIEINRARGVVGVEHDAG